MEISSVIIPLLVLSLCVSSAFASNILCLFTSTGTSHMIIHMALARTLAESGHNVTVVTILPLKDKNPKYNHIYLEPPEEEFASYRKKLTSASLEKGWNSMKSLFWVSVERVELQARALQNPRFQELMNNPGNKFDAVIVGVVFNTYLIGVAAHFKCPIMLSWVNQPNRQYLSFVGSPWSVSSVAVFGGGSADMIHFRTRLSNMFMAGLLLAIDLFADFKMGQYYDYHFPADKYPSYDEMKKNISLVFCATHFSEGRIRPLTPGFIEIGGIQVKEKPDPLPIEVEDFIKNATDGFILFSLGTNVKTTDISTNATSAMFKVLSESKYKVLWKWDSIDPPGTSSNIMFHKWFPQDDILAHPKLKLFITHAGRGSSTEAQYHGVPMLAIPVYGDQPSNAQEVVDMGYGLIVCHRNVTEESFHKDFYEVLDNPKYSKTISKFSKIFRDRPISARQSVVYWTEYVIRHRGARHMQSPVIHLNFFQTNSLDVIGVILLVLYLIYWVLKRTFRLLCALPKLLCSRKLKTE